ncbi:Hypothetical predicted protein, partial [Olea europaea subsp. europaea]
MDEKEAVTLRQDRQSKDGTNGTKTQEIKKIQSVGTSALWLESRCYGVKRQEEVALQHHTLGVAVPPHKVTQRCIP